MTSNSWKSRLWCCVAVAAIFVGSCASAPAQDAQASDDTRVRNYIVDVDLPLVGQRDEQVIQQVTQIIGASPVAGTRPTIVLQFRARAVTGFAGNEMDGIGTRGSSFERCLSLARFLSGPKVTAARLVAFLPDSIEGHAVLPVLACEEIVASSTATVGRATIDEPLDGAIEANYQEIVSRRLSMPWPVVRAMLRTDSEVYEATLNGEAPRLVDRQELDQLRDAGQLLGSKTIWAGGSLATFTGQQLRNQLWSLGTADDAVELQTVLNLNSALWTTRQLPRQWKPMQLTVSGKLPASRVNQVIRSVNRQVQDGELNLLYVRVEPTTCRVEDAMRLASFLAEQDPEQLYTVGVVQGNVQGAAGLLAVACDDAVLLAEASVGPLDTAGASDDSLLRGLDEFSLATGRPFPLLSVLVDSSVIVNDYVQQETGKRAIFTEQQIAMQADANLWLAKSKVAGGETVPTDVALRYRLFDSQDDTETLVLSRLGIEQAPAELQSPWLESSIQMVLSQSWLPRFLLTIGFFALMAELGSPGLTVGGLLAAVCFVGFFWVEGLNGNVEALEVLLFIGGLVALALEIFVLPGFGVFGIAGLLMLLVSVVLASQTFVWPTTSAQLSEVSVNLFWVSCLALGGMISLLFMHKQLERSPLLKWVTLQPVDEDEAADLNARETLAHREHLLGQTGLTTTRLNPSGKAQFGRDIVAVVGTGKLIGTGVPVRVVEVRGPLVLVEELE